MEVHLHVDVIWGWVGGIGEQVASWVGRWQHSSRRGEVGGIFNWTDGESGCSSIADDRDARS